MARLTAARRRALEVFKSRSVDVRVSNATDASAGTVYWQTARWLVDEGYATSTYKSGVEHLALTDAGSAALYPDSRKGR